MPVSAISDSVNHELTRVDDVMAEGTKHVSVSLVLLATLGFCAVLLPSATPLLADDLLLFGHLSIPNSRCHQRHGRGAGWVGMLPK